MPKVKYWYVITTKVVTGAGVLAGEMAALEVIKGGAEVGVLVEGVVDLVVTDGGEEVTSPCVVLKTVVVMANAGTMVVGTPYMLRNWQADMAGNALYTLVGAIFQFILLNSCSCFVNVVSSVWMGHTPSDAGTVYQVIPLQSEKCKDVKCITAVGQVLERSTHDSHPTMTEN